MLALKKSAGVAPKVKQRIQYMLYSLVLVKEDTQYMTLKTKRAIKKKGNYIYDIPLSLIYSLLQKYLLFAYIVKNTFLLK